MRLVCTGSLSCGTSTLLDKVKGARHSRTSSTLLNELVQAGTVHAPVRKFDWLGDSSVRRIAGLSLILLNDVE